MEIQKFRGIKNTTSAERLKPGELAAASDVDIDGTGKLLSRRGMEQLSAAASHSIYSDHEKALVVQSGVLKAVEADDSLTTVRALSTDAPMSYATVLGVTYCSNGVDVGRVVGRTWSEWGVAPPASQPSAAAVAGTLAPGRYMYAMTFVRDDGHESGTGVAGAVDLPAGGGISFSGMEVSTNQAVRDKILYLSSAGGETLRRAFSVPNAETSYLYPGPGSGAGLPLQTQHAQAAPAGTTVRHFNGSNYVVVGDTVYHSDPYQPELFRLDTGFLRFPGQVSMFECVNQGIYVSTADSATGGGKAWYLAGGRPDALGSKEIYDFGAIPGTAVRTAAAHFQPPDPDAPRESAPAIVWATRHGVCVGFDGGVTHNLTENKYSFPTAARGAGMVRLVRGYTQYVVTLQAPGEPTNIYL